MFESAEPLREEFAQLEAALSDPATHADLARAELGEQAVKAWPGHRAAGGLILLRFRGAFGARSEQEAGDGEAGRRLR